MGDARIGEGGGSKFERVLETLRTRIAEGRYPVGVSLPPQRQLVEELHVSRDTVQRVLARLSDEGWVESRQGSGTRVLGAQRVRSRGRASAGRGGEVTLRSFFDDAFGQSEVCLDIHTLTSESLSAHIQLQAERIRDREITPQRIVLRMLLPRESMPLPYPTVKGSPDDMRPQERLREITRMYGALMRKTLEDLKREGLVSHVEVTMRHVPLAPTFKVYLLNRTEALHGFYEVVERTIEVGGNEEVEARDVLGLGATLTHHVKDTDPSSQGTDFVEAAQAWFDSAWKLLTDEGG
ncbi:GntR family transcriptional regulator [Streptomyces europaeiscabiei]|uniref:GntR family transcriptional regulator n=1 Tax=Streptomyces europaeiscabiei TaxID=146819 RepID=A0AAJ2PU01_9ACTN|nr:MULTISPECIES: GntR family transcriptional regulator [Streptomyces]MDX3133422.1 GntR family transcriptional regulator [Streptomyces europaeiscabiei]